MQIVISAICTDGPSLRERIGDDPQLDEYLLAIDKKQTPGRKPGWLKLKSSDKQRGAINVVWDSQANILTARVITKGSARPSAIVGDFIIYLLSRHGRRVRAVTTAIVK